MKHLPVSSAVLLSAGLAITLVLGGCATVSPHVQATPEPAPVVLPPKPRYAAPIDSHRFDIDPATDDVVGQVQVTVASKADTLPDIARRFNVGYEEIVRANPGVDPWLPGEGREVVVPTQFILPSAPREGLVINIAGPRESSSPGIYDLAVEYLTRLFHGIPLDDQLDKLPGA